jgi:hypothetical protein
LEDKLKEQTQLAKELEDKLGSHQWSWDNGDSTLRNEMRKNENVGPRGQILEDRQSARKSVLAEKIRELREKIYPNDEKPKEKVLRLTVMRGNKLKS